MRDFSALGRHDMRQPPNLTLFALASATCMTAFFTGCNSRPSRVEVPAFDPPGMTETVFEKYDANKDGSVTVEELASAPGIIAAFKAIDTNGNGQADRAEFEQHLKDYSVGRIGSQSLTCFVNLNGQPLANAIVDFIPEDFMADLIEPGRCTTSNHGSGPVLPLTAGSFPGIAPGMYKVTISLKNGEQEMLPPQYNSQSKLGFEVSNALGGAPATFNLAR